MPYATNPVDGVRTYFEDLRGAGAPVLFYSGFADPLEVAKASRLARALCDEFRLIVADHRRQGGSDKPRDRVRRSVRSEALLERYWINEWLPDTLTS